MKFIVICHENVSHTYWHPSNNIQVVFSNPRIFPRLEQLKFSAHCGSQNSNQVFTIPLPIHNLPSLKSLHLILSGVIIEPLVVACGVPARWSSLFLDDCWDIGRDWVVQLLRFLKVHGRLDSLHISTSNVDFGAWVRTEGDYKFSRAHLSELAELSPVHLAAFGQVASGDEGA